MTKTIMAIAQTSSDPVSTTSTWDANQLTIDVSNDAICDGVPATVESISQMMKTTKPVQLFVILQSGQRLKKCKSSGICIHMVEFTAQMH